MRTKCEGLVRIRERVVFRASSVHDTVDTSSSGHLRSVGRLSDDVWYFCVSRAPLASLEWFTVDAGTESSEDEDVAPSTGSDAVLLANINVSGVEAVDGENVKLPDEDKEDAGVFVNMVDDLERQHLETVSFYVEDELSGIALLIETESETQRDQWVTFLGALLNKETQEQENGEVQEAGENVGEDVDLMHFSESRSSISMRSLLHQGKSENLVEEGDPFGLLSLTTSALSSMNPTDELSVKTNNAAPGMFAMDHFELAEGNGHEEIEDTGDSDTSVANTDADYVADTAVDPSLLLSSGRGQMIETRERSNSNVTDPLSSSMIQEPASSNRSRRHSLGAVFGSTPKSTDGCLRCSKKFGRLIHTPKICASCSNRFCRDHCNQWTPLTTPESISLSVRSMVGSRVEAKAVPAAELKRVCMDCLVRQQLLTSLQEAGVYYASAVDEAGGLSRLVRWKYFDQGPKHEIEAHIRARSLGPLSLLSAMFKYRQQPFMFVVVLAQLVHNVENCLDTMDFYWPQFLQWGFVNLPDASPSVRAFYLFFLAATARRSVHLAVKATWECIAAHWDAMAGGLYKRGNGIVVMLFFVTNVNFGEPRSVLPQLLFPQAPLHQRESFEKLLDQLYEYVRRAYAASQREAPFFEWLLARSKEEIIASSRNVQKQLRVGDGFLDPFPADYHEEAQLMILERRRSGTQHLVETKQRMWNKSDQHIFSDEVRLVRFLVDLCTYLKENISEPSLRKKQLPALLQEMLRAKHIRPEAALPLSGVMARGHRVVNVLTDEGTVFSTKARAPTLVFFEIIASALECEGKARGLDIGVNHDSEVDALVDAAVDMENERDGLLEPEQQEILNYLDGEVVGTYVADLVPACRTSSQASLRSSISEDLDGLNQVLSVGCTPLSEKAVTGAFSDNSQLSRWRSRWDLRSRLGSSMTSSQASLRSSISEDLDGLNQVLPVGCTPLSEKAVTGAFSDDESDGFGVDEIGGEDSTDTSGSLDSASSSQVPKCPFFGERFGDTQKRIREQSTFSRFDGWALVPVIAKSFDDMRQEVFVLQGLKLFQLIFRKHGLHLWMRYYSIVCAGKDCGLLEVITDAQSLDGLKKKGKNISGVGTSLPKIFERACGRDPVTGDHDPVRLERARANFITSMAAYSLFSYIFLVKDRHNGNIMLDTEGHVVHIDFGFVLGIAPGNTFSLETAPFKLTPEMVEIMGAEGFDRYRQLVAQGLLALHLEAPQLLSLVYLSSKESCFPCFKGRSRARIVRRLCRRLCMGWGVQDVERTAARIVDKSNGHRGTRQYDWFQKISNGILP
ncbi:LOW QUALITY PROTEIN: Phosphatidylinositol kinase (PIK-I) [Phytophthora palmivora]|uniref:Phosphatidylinositol kinase (PIK-I) n=1 Tax=Phytophthora palmivora TaxID=4796 RepID=A0A2P4WYC9_9STRA|nr:LOW QUALITY PROTEIN: Phosphatidylinositol kinase (PIK-I) [Phytophthora palmivora]